MASIPTIKDGTPLHTIPIDKRPPHGPLFSKVFFPLVFNLGQLGIHTAQLTALPLLLIPFVGRRWFRAVIDWTKDGYGRLLIAITVLFAPTSLILTTDTPPDIANLVERDPVTGAVQRINLPPRLVIMANHQAYTDWMYLWIVACYSGHARGVIILLKVALKNIPVVGWGMQFFQFIFMQRSWAADRANLTLALNQLGQAARGNQGSSSSSTADTTAVKANGEGDALLSSTSQSRSSKGKSPLWLLIFPEGTITSDEERVKSKRFAEREGIPDFITLLHPRSTGLLFCLRTLQPQVPDLQLLDVTIGYPGVPYGKYPQEWYGLLSIFFRSVPPPTVHLHLHLYSDLGDIPSIVAKPEPKPTPVTNYSNETIAVGASEDGTGTEARVKPDTGLASPAEAKAFELWLRGVWEAKEKRMEGFYKDQKFQSGEGGEQAREVVPIKQLKWGHWIGAFGAGGFGTIAVLGVAIWRAVVAAAAAAQ